jgi:hypothetical protein
VDFWVVLICFHFSKVRRRNYAIVNTKTWFALKKLFKEKDKLAFFKRIAAINLHENCNCKETIKAK